MSRKIPLEATIGGAYGFLFSDILSIIGIAWFPLLVFGGLAGAAIWFGAVAHPLPEFHATRDPQEFMRENMPLILVLVRVFSLVVLCLFVFAIMFLTGVTRKALGLMEGPTFFYFNLGPSFWRMFGAVIIALLLLAVLRIAMHLLALAWLGLAAPALPQGIAVLVDVLGAVTFFCLFVYVLVRLLFFLPAVVVAENSIGIARAWSLGAGNFWRAFAVWLAVILPAAIALGIVSSIVYSFLIAGAIAGFPVPPFAGETNPNPDEVMAWLPKLFTFLGHVLKAYWPVIVATQLITGIVIRSLVIGASAKAYIGVSGAGGLAEETE
jgi:hypothetical protein